MAEPLLLLEETGFTRDATFALRIRHLAVHPGEAVAIVGRSGSGKSTCLDIMAGILRPGESGTFRFRSGDAGLSLAALWARGDQPALRRWRSHHVGYVLQTGGLVPFLSLAANIALPLGLAGAGGPERVQHLLQALGLAGLGGRKPRQVSIGQRQRAALARALAIRPALLLADEPTASLDEETAEAVMREMTGLARDERSALVMVTHDPDLARRHGLRLVHCGQGEQSGLSVIDDRVAA